MCAPSIGCSPASQVEDRPGRETAFFGGKPANHRRRLFDQQEPPTRNFRQHEIYVFLLHLVEDTRARCCRCDAIHRDVVPRQFLAHGLRQGDDARLRGRIGAGIRVALLDRKSVV